MTIDILASILASMSSRNEFKIAYPGSVHHVYNRGVERRPIFMDGYDYRRFTQQMSQFLVRESEVGLLAYSLMPNHFHLLIRQTNSEGMGHFLRRLATGYVMYFNKRHKRVGPLFQGKYKAAPIIGPRQLMEVSRYIHLNPERAGLGWRHNEYTSLADYLEPAASGGFVDPAPVLNLFDVPGDYRRYLELRP